MNGSWGTSIITGSVSAGTFDSHTFTMAKDASWDTGNLSVVAYLYNSTDNTIVQVEDAPVD